MTAALDVRLRQRFPVRGTGAFTLEVDFTAPPGFTILFGPSGAGKTTALECIAGLQRPETGHVEIAGEALFDSSAGIDRPPQSRAFGYVFQTLALFPHLTARQNVAFGLRGLPEAEKNTRIKEALESFHIAHLADVYLHTVSGGERQRVALARALVTRPRALLLDEPLSALELKIRLKILSDLRAWWQEHPIPIVYVTHSLEEAFALDGQVVALDKGAVIRQGSASDVLAGERVALIAALG